MTNTQLTFADLSLPNNILEAITSMGYQTPTPIQAQAIPSLMAGTDVVGIAQTGTGKTAAFALPMIAHVNPEFNEVQALVLAPTRELALQGAQAIHNFASQTGGLEVVAVYGGAAYGPQLKALKEGAQIVVGTPGRIMDLIDRGALSLGNVHYFVLDEADEMLRMGFAEDVEKIASDLPQERISALFSATMPAPIRKVAQTHLRQPVEITITPQASTVDTITQTFAVVPNRHKIGALSRVLATTEADATIVFVRTRATAEELSLELSSRGIQTAALSGDVAQQDRERLIQRLKDGLLDVLVATDVAARGLDVDRVGLVVNFDVPREVDTYVHRIGRTGRAGRTGTALTFVTPKECSRLRRIEAVTKAKMQEVTLPTPAEVSAFRSRKLITQAVERFQAGRLHVYEEVVAEFTQAAQSSGLNVSRNDLLLAIMALAVRDYGPTPHDEPEVLTEKFSAKEAKGTNGKIGKDRKRAGKTATRASFGNSGQIYRVEVGHRDGVSPGSIVGAITNECGLHGSQLGRIDIFPSFSLVEIEVELDAHTMRKVSRAHVSGRALNISKDRGPRTNRENKDKETLTGTKKRSAKSERKLARDSRNTRKHGKTTSKNGIKANKMELFDTSHKKGKETYSETETRKYRADRRFGEEKRRKTEARKGQAKKRKFK